MLTQALLILLSFAILTAGAESLVRGAAALGMRMGLSPLVVGLTIVAFGTSAPELAVSAEAALMDVGDIAAGNVIGSNIFNVAVVLGLAAAVRPVTVHLQVIRLDTPLMLAVSAGFALMLKLGGGLARWEAGLLFAGIVAYAVHSVRQARREPFAPTSSQAPDVLAVPKAPLPLWIALTMVAGGFALLAFGAGILVDNAVALARSLEVSEAVIGLTIVAAGTSLPELATSVVASIRHETDIAIGNVVGSNIFNVLCIGGVSGLISPVISDGIRGLDLIWMLGTSALLLPLMRSGFRLVRWEGVALLACYGAYLATLWPR